MVGKSKDLKVTLFKILIFLACMLTIYQRTKSLDEKNSSGLVA